MLKRDKIKLIQSIKLRKQVIFDVYRGLSSANSGLCCPQALKKNVTLQNMQEVVFTYIIWCAARSGVRLSTSLCALDRRQCAWVQVTALKTHGAAGEVMAVGQHGLCKLMRHVLDRWQCAQVHVTVLKIHDAAGEGMADRATRALQADEACAWSCPLGSNAVHSSAQAEAISSLFCPFYPFNDNLNARTYNTIKH